ncbi:MAG: hypothetical protein A2144_09590 [Chloroflexi bacterium RBG_16_50_9]|nr:MAG: hypothetical protein A2144_09590 [Chloroflexi bacterium RBG_16_50_9]
MTEKTEPKIVLIIEDDFDVLKFVSRVLELEGYQVLTASCYDSGMEMIRESTIDLVLLDLILPGRDGWSILQEMKSAPDFSSIPVVVLTAIAELQQRKRTLRMGATDYLIKPLSAKKLKNTVSSVLRQQQTLPKSANIINL